MHNNKLSSRHLISNIDISIQELIDLCNRRLTYAPSDIKLELLVLFCKQIQSGCLKVWLKNNKITTESAILYATHSDDIITVSNDPLIPPVAIPSATKIIKDLQLLAVHISLQSSNTDLNTIHGNIMDVNISATRIKSLRGDSREMIFSRGMGPHNQVRNLPALAEYDLNNEESCLIRPFTAFFRLMCS